MVLILLLQLPPVTTEYRINQRHHLKPNIHTVCHNIVKHIHRLSHTNTDEEKLQNLETQIQFSICQRRGQEQIHTYTYTHKIHTREEDTLPYTYI